MNVLGVDLPIPDEHPDCDWLRFVFGFVVRDLCDIDDTAGDDDLLFQLGEFYWKEFWRPWSRHMSVPSIDGVFQDSIAVSLRRLQNLVGSLGPELDAALHQWLNTEG